MPPSQGLLALLWLGACACWPLSLHSHELPFHASQPDAPASLWLVSALLEDAAGEFGRGHCKVNNALSPRPLLKAKRQEEGGCTPMHQLRDWAACEKVSGIAVGTFSPHAPWVYGHIYTDTLYILYNMLMRPGARRVARAEFVRNSTRSRPKADEGSLPPELRPIDVWLAAGPHLDPKKGPGSFQEAEALFPEWLSGWRVRRAPWVPICRSDGENVNSAFCARAGSIPAVLRPGLALMLAHQYKVCFF
jgi:hypothetical protein